MHRTAGNIVSSVTAYLKEIGHTVKVSYDHASLYDLNKLSHESYHSKIEIGTPCPSIIVEFAFDKVRITYNSDFVHCVFIDYLDPDFIDKLTERCSLYWWSVLRNKYKC